MGRAVARPKFREETPKTNIATGAGESIAGTGVSRCPNMPIAPRNFKRNFAMQKILGIKIQYISNNLSCGRMSIAAMQKLHVCVRTGPK
ncbi:MAG: hypothetical protein F4114_14080 [Rhodospirillaceae bacterium]|nr:hypothetical protein [Rhodospirillaceae bacterium]MYB15072.1 hypothetical protein [Rhodospirillaceae bacterium]MYI50198.1 hypothetical protein [Rhodospirillaceae bacterium]